MRLLMKFGGTSVADAQCIRRVVDILEKHHKTGDEVAVVVSAQRGVTDQLIALAEKLPTAKDCSEVAPLIALLRERHMTALEGTAPGYIKEVGAVIEKRLASLQHILFAIYNLRELTPRSKDYVISYGERLLAPVIGALSASGASRRPCWTVARPASSPPPSTARRLPCAKAMSG